MIEVRGLTVVLEGRRVLDGVDLVVPAGHLLALVGPSGAGKTVLLKALCGLLPAAEGTIRIAGVEVTGRGEAELFAIRREIGMLFQAGALFDQATVFDNVAFPLRRRGVSEAEVSRRVEEELGRVGLLDSASRLPHELSGGMRKRVGIARALVAEPPVALFDEPTAGLDPVTASRILGLLSWARDARGVAAIAVGNEVHALLPVCDAVALLHEGRLLHHGPPAGLPDAASPVVRQFFSGSPEGPL